MEQQALPMRLKTSEGRRRGASMAKTQLNSIQSMVTAESSDNPNKDLQIFRSNTGLYDGTRFARQVWTSQDSRKKSVV